MQLGKDTGLIQIGPNDPRRYQLRTTGTTTIKAQGWRPGTKHKTYPVNFVLTGGGLGDYICHMAAFEWLAETQPHVQGKLFTANPFYEVAKFIMGKYPQWKVCHPGDLDKEVKKGEAVCTPAQYIKYVDAVGSHLLDLGFMFYAKRQGPPSSHNRMTDLSHYSSGKKWDLPEKYAILTPGYTSVTRIMRGKYVNELSKYLVDAHGVTPVYLGKKIFVENEKNHTVHPDYKTSVDESFDPSLGIDLREQTSLLEAVEIMRDAKVVLGVDNGLLHFAGCTEVPIIFGHTITDVEHRSIRRPKGETINICISKKDLPCSGCQSNMRFCPEHDFKRCLYGDYLCVDYLFGGNCKTWKDAIDHMMNLDCKDSEAEVE